MLGQGRYPLLVILDDTDRVIDVEAGGVFLHQQLQEPGPEQAPQGALTRSSALRKRRRCDERVHQLRLHGYADATSRNRQKSEWSSPPR